MGRSAIILAGGFGTRLLSVVADVPKPMASIAERPFLEYVLDYLIHFGVTDVVFSTGHLAETVSDHFGDQYRSVFLQYAVENEPLGTGGAIKFAMSKCASDDVMVINGDTFFDANLDEVYDFHHKKAGDVSIVLREVEQPDRFGTVEMNADNQVTAFREKQVGLSVGLINAGTYIMKRSVFDKVETAEMFSIEQDFFAKHCEDLKIYGLQQVGYFIDIGIPEEFYRANDEFRSFKY